MTLALYRSGAQKLLNYFADATITHVDRSNNKYTDCLAMLASKLQFEGLGETLIVKRWTGASTWLLQSKDTETNDWRTPIIQELNNALISAEIKIPSARIATASGVQWNEAEISNAVIAELDALYSKRTKAEEHAQAYINRVSRSYDKAIKPRIFQVGDLVMKTAKHIHQDMSAPKFSPKWEGKYVVTKAYNSGYYKIIKEDGGKLEAVINGKWLKEYYA
ncbi:uncharacterized protein LOC113331005 [Papaver somniferum]|uniref:uncharacterized protein LOC113331005 n=1 Tax=Papaver somniferum TaxID=3469 RepID=UPI000E6F8D99|nr:uncharacterized protein LOC113331005 [Papaver somniferum]